MARIKLGGLTDFQMSSHGAIRFGGTDELRGASAIEISNPEDVKALADFLQKTMLAWEHGFDGLNEVA